MTKDYEVYMNSIAKKTGKAKFKWPIGNIQGKVKPLVTVLVSNYSEVSAIVAKDNGNVIYISMDKVLEYDAAAADADAAADTEESTEPTEASGLIDTSRCKILAEGLTNPKGLALYKTGLFVSDFNKISFIPNVSLPPPKSTKAPKAPKAAPMAPKAPMAPPKAASTLSWLDSTFLVTDNAFDLKVLGDTLYALGSGKLLAIKIVEHIENDNDGQNGHTTRGHTTCGHSAQSFVPGDIMTTKVEGDNFAFGPDLGDSDPKCIYISDFESSTIKTISLGDNLDVKTISGTKSGFHNGLAHESKYHGPSGMVWHNSKLYIVDSYNMRVRILYQGLTHKCKKALMVKDLCGSMGYKAIFDDENRIIERIYKGPFFRPYGICVGPNGSLLVSDKSGIFEIT
jgi:hypothetical protein